MSQKVISVTIRQDTNATLDIRSFLRAEEGSDEFLWRVIIE